MSLRAWQMALGRLLTAAAPAPMAQSTSVRPAFDLSQAEQQWLSQAANSRGLVLTRNIQRSWRRMRLRSTLNLLWSVFPELQRELLVDQYLESVPCVSFFDIPEACAFLDFALPRLPPLPHLRSLCLFERQLLAASAEAAFPNSEGRLDARSVLELHPAAGLVAFTADPFSILEATLAGCSLPAPGDKEYLLLIAPGLPERFREPTPKEVALAQALPCTLQPGASPNSETWKIAKDLFEIRFLRSQSQITGQRGAKKAESHEYHGQKYEQGCPLGHL